MEKEANLKILIKPSDMHHYLVQQTYRSFSGWFGVLLSIAALVALVTGYQTNEAYKNVILLIIGALFLVVQPLQLKMQSIQKVRSIPMFQEPLEYKINHEGIKVSQKDEEMAVEWNSIRKVIETGKSILVFTSPVSAFIFPKEQYADQVDIVREIIKENVKEEQCKWRKN